MSARKKAKRALAAEIWDAIHQGAFRPGEWLRQIDLEEKFGATRFDVRTALEELVVRHAIEHVPNRGYRVTEIDIDTLHAIRSARVILETAAAPAIIANVVAADLTKLTTLADEFSTVVRAGTRAEQSRINRAFHELMYRRCGNPVLEELIWDLRDRGRGAPMTVWASHESLLRSDRDHHDMLAAIRARDAKALADLIASHILKDPP